jgi:hypothetical protein
MPRVVVVFSAQWALSIFELNINILVWNIWGKQPRASHGHKWKDNIKEDIRKAGHLLNSTSSTGTNNQLLWTQWWTFCFNNRRNILTIWVTIHILCSTPYIINPWGTHHWSYAKVSYTNTSIDATALISRHSKSSVQCGHPGHVLRSDKAVPELSTLKYLVKIL